MRTILCNLLAIQITQITVVSKTEARTHLLISGKVKVNALLPAALCRRLLQLWLVSSLRMQLKRWVLQKDL